MKTNLLLFLLLLKSITSSAQNLVPNPSFEDTVSCPDNLDQVNRANFWFAGDGTPDYFNSCFTIPSGIWNVDVPSNSFGYQNGQQGQGYVGLATYYTGGGPSIREAVGSILTNPLQTNQIYYVSMYVSLRNANLGTVASNKIGMWFSNQLFSPINPVPRNNQSQIFTDSIIGDTLNWVNINGKFTADSNYTCIYIGNFFADSLVSYNLFQGTTGTSYYYVDDVCISTDSNYCATWTGVKEVPNDKAIRLSTNPTNGNSTIYYTLPTNKNGKLQIIDLLGKQVYKQTLPKLSTMQQINLQQLATGMYLIKITSGTVTNTVKFVKQ